MGRSIVDFEQRARARGRPTYTQVEKTRPGGHETVCSTQLDLAVWYPIEGGRIFGDLEGTQEGGIEWIGPRSGRREGALPTQRT